MVGHPPSLGQNSLKNHLEGLVSVLGGTDDDGREGGETVRRLNPVGILGHPLRSTVVVLGIVS
jgi:hypothetical protein